jgi:hypothetical protein
VKGRKDDGFGSSAAKARFDLLPWAAIREIGRVLAHGAIKYGDNNWQHVENPRPRYFAAAMRHLTAWWDGEQEDIESKLSHLAHAGCCILFLLWFDSVRPIQNETCTRH